MERREENVFRKKKGEWILLSPGILPSAEPIRKASTKLFYYSVIIPHENMKIHSVYL